MSYLDKLQPVTTTKSGGSSGTKSTGRPYLDKLQGVSQSSSGTEPSQSFGHKVAGALEGASDFLNQNVARPFVSLAAKPIQAIAKYKGLPDPYANEAMAGIHVSPLDKPGEIAGDVLEAGSYAFPYGKVAEGASLLAKPLLGRAGGKIAGNIASGLLGGYGVDVGTNLSGGATGPEALKPGLGTALGGAIPALPLIPKALRGATAAFKPPVPTPFEAAGQITQLPDKATEVALRTLKNIDTTGVKTYRDLAKVLQENVDYNKKFVDREFESLKDKPRTLKDFTQTNTVKVGKKTISAKQNIVKDALRGLQQAYTASAQPEDALRIRALAQRAKTTGLTAKEVNDLAREYGTEFKAKGFSKFGEALTTTSDRAFENTRSGLKDLARSRLKSKEAVAADKEISDQLNTKKMVEKMADRVEKLGNRIQKRGLVERISRELGKYVDLATFGGPKAFITKLLFPSNVGLKTGNALDFQERLSKNLSLIQEIEHAPDGLAARLIAQLMKKTEGLTGSLSKIRTPGDALIERSQQIAKETGGNRGFVAIPGLPKAPGGVPNTQFQGFDDITSKILDDLKGRSTISKQYLLDALNRPNIKQAEKDIVRKLLEDEPANIGVQRFAAKVKSELLPLSRNKVTTKWESINLSDEIRGPVANYNEHVYESPIKTSAGSVHFSGAARPTEAQINSGTHSGSPENYFAHTRVEDLPKQAEWGSTSGEGDTRRIVELQSDLFQKGRLEKEVNNLRLPHDEKWGWGMGESYGRLVERKNYIQSLLENPAKSSDGISIKEAKEQLKQIEAGMAHLDSQSSSRVAEVSKLEPFQNTWHERVVREEIKQAAKDGKTKLQFPTGKTAAQIEGFVGDTHGGVPQDAGVGETFDYGGTDYQVVEDLGDEVMAVPADKVDSYHWHTLRDEEVNNVAENIDYALRNGDADEAERYLPEGAFKQWQKVSDDNHLTIKYEGADKLALYDDGDHLVMSFKHGSPQEQNARELVAEGQKKIREFVLEHEDYIQEQAEAEIADRFKNSEQAAEYMNEMGADRTYFADGEYVSSYETGDSETMSRGSSGDDNFDPEDLPDTQRAIYDFYQKDLGKYLQKKFDAKLVHDAQDVSWWEVNVPKEKAKLPVEAFGVIPGALGIGALNQGRRPEKTPQSL